MESMRVNLFWGVKDRQTVEEEEREREDSKGKEGREE